MASEVVVDSNVFMKLLRSRQDPARVLIDAYGLGGLAICGMIRLEVLRGLSEPRLFARISALMDVMVNVPSDNRLWTDATELAWKLDRQGLVIPSADVVIAASALRLGAAVLTSDSHFAQIKGLRVIAPPAEWFGA
ncbi:MAG: PIN domain-containing protein [Verrucomicrobiota bacterium]